MFSDRPRKKFRVSFIEQIEYSKGSGRSQRFSDNIIISLCTLGRAVDCIINVDAESFKYDRDGSRSWVRNLSNCWLPHLILVLCFLNEHRLRENGVHRI